MTKNGSLDKGGGVPGSSSNGLQRTVQSRIITVGNTNPSGKGMNGNCYSSDGLNPTLTCNKQEGNRVAIPVLTPDRAKKDKMDGDLRKMVKKHLLSLVRIGTELP